ncbi:CDP-glycerol glycerophosphotransferase family protein [Homoserinibacter sp. YIM 151385]|uniref:CDP-glycerol glycerophosphotransferase family protein n=1 Tax=Homoserinibacter sp. YIM 151385 TaxID=2985506 RepID=UPI0022F086F0|nr:CDP-glycerol glycerophosphotransferase family protein [Homoserinibacter sp. YIM 151385]WBU38164.1 CDP-glycerol glycerophosphotransferase family protein [Homoserinibacter sp. YIM 151385]
MSEPARVGEEGPVLDPAMATFTFGAGNARKLLRLPLYGLGALASRVVPRRDRLWVVGSGIGLGEGALPLALAVREHLERNVRVVWLAGGRDELLAARRLGLDAVLKDGWRGFRLTLRARVAIVTHGFGDVNRYAVQGATVVQLWHGIPLKRLHLDSPATLRVSFLPDLPPVRALLRRAYRAAGRGIALFPVSSDRVAARIRTAFGIPADRVVVTGDIRDDVLLRGTAAERRAHGRRLLEGAVGALPEGARVVLYAPTWRDGRPDPGIPSPREWSALESWLERRDAVLLVRSHPLGRGSYADGAEGSARIRMLDTAGLADVTPALPAVDALVTDYSSIAYDFALTGGAIVFLAPDVERYAKSRGLYEPYRDVTAGRHQTSWTGALGLLEAWADDRLAGEDAQHAERLRREHFDLLDGRATERVLTEILRRIGRPVPASLRVAGDGASGSAGTPRLERPAVTGLAFDAPRAELRVRTTGLPRGARLVLAGGRATVEDAGSGEEAVFPLLRERWGAEHLALPSGDYALRIERDGEAPATRLELGARPVHALHDLLRLDAVAEAGGLVVRIGPPLADDELGAAAQARLEREYRAAPDSPEEAVFFESFYGRSASCNPLGIDRALARLHPEVTRYWSVADASVEVPPGAVRIVEGTREWWRVRRSARLLVVNDWLRKRWRRRPYQRVLQTWHGTMLKRLALDRAARGIRTRLAVLRERDRWDVLLAQNRYSAEIFRSAYAFRGPIWIEGYPRDDVLAEPDTSAIRGRLGIPADARVVLYAPTWRDDRTEMVDYLELESFAEELPEDAVLLVRGHSRTLPFGRDLRGERLVDATTYPSVADLLAVADILVTDYSSVMFDFATRDRPYVFFTPDLAHYSEDLRGFYFDLLAEAPGPVVSSREGLLEVLSALVRGEDDAAAFAGRRRVWRERFTPMDDGDAGERVVARLRREGLLG